MKLFDSVFQRVKGGYFGILTALSGTLTISISAILYLFAEPFTIFSRYISNLGAPFTPLGFSTNGSNLVFTLGLIITGFFAFLFFIFLYRFLKQGLKKNKWIMPISHFLALTSVLGLWIVAIFDYQTNIIGHAVGATMFFFGGFLTVLTFGVTILLNSEISKNQFIAGLIVAVAFFMFILNLMPHAMNPESNIVFILQSMDPEIAMVRFWEWMILLTLLFWFFEMGLYTLYYEKKVNLENQ